MMRHEPCYLGRVYGSAKFWPALSKLGELTEVAWSKDWVTGVPNWRGLHEAGFTEQ